MPHSKIFLAADTEDGWVPMTETPYDQEVVLQTALAHYPDLIPGDQINPDNPRRWLLVRRELGIPDRMDGGDTWSLDHLFLDQDGIPTFVECKRSQDTRGRREVVAQMLDYAANGTEYWPIDKLRQAAAETARRQEKDLDEEIQLLLDDEEATDVDRYWQRVEENLREGKIRLVFVADAIPSPLRRLVEFLNEKMNDVEVLAVEVKQFRGEGQRAMVPRVIGITEETRRAKQGTQRKLANRQEFFKTCSPETIPFYNTALNMAQEAGFEINWGTKGFSLRFDGEERKVSFAYGYPPNIFDFYFGYFKYSRMTAEETAALRQEIRECLGEVETRGKYTMRVEITQESIGELNKALVKMIEKAKQLHQPAA